MNGSINLNGFAAVQAMFRSRSCLYDEDCNYCIDAPLLIPSGSTTKVWGSEKNVFAMPSYEWRDQ
jgi:hypothetical protein